MNINQLRYFIAAAEYKSFTKSANQFYISQTAITQQIQSLEERMDVQLFDRSKRPIELTPAGNVFLSEAKAIVSRIDRALEKVQEASTGLVGSIRIGYTKGYERSNLSEILRIFHLEYPNILLSCYRGDTDTLAAGLFNGDYDIIFTWDSTNITQETEVKWKIHEMSPLVVAMHKHHIYAHRDVLTRQELKNESIIYMTPSSTGESYGDDHFMELYKQAGYLPQILLRSSDAESVLMMVAAEEGISILPDYVTKKLIRADNLEFVPLKGKDEFAKILRVWRKHDSNIALQHFLETLDKMDGKLGKRKE
ncbi:MAG: LysR family transcriptional regulator [Schaedlerella sp.]|nr:LysR family transcriptional regulator [Schaedlerella sp.]